MARKVTTKEVATTKAAPRAKAAVRAKPEPAAAPAPTADERDYLVIFEEPDPYGLPADDVLVLDIETGSHKRPEVDVQQKVKLELTNTTSRLGTIGYIVSLLGAVLGLILMVAFAIIYPERWYGWGEHAGSQVSTVRTVILLAVASIAFMILGTALTHYGRRIQARSELSDVRIVEKAPSRSTSFE